MTEFWIKTSGTWINIMTVVFGTTLGLLVGQRLPQRMQQIITQAVGLLTLWIGMSMAGEFANTSAGAIDGAILGLLAMVIGGFLGEWWRLEDRLAELGNWLKQTFKGRGRFTEGFVATSLLFCIGPMALIGSINNGLSGDNRLLVLKAMMDGLASIPFASAYGIGVGFSTLSLLVYQGSISLLAGAFASENSDPSSDPIVLLLTGIGGLMILGIGFNLLEVVRIRVASFLPALAIAPVLFWLADRIS
jgi:uncharacterized membrane protein YqgA involved in biofilm formation